MPTGRKRFESSLKELLGEKQDKPKLYPALLGAYVDGIKQVKNANRPDFVYCRMRGSTSEVISAFNDAVGLHWDLPVLVYRDPLASDQWKIYGRDTRAYQDWEGASYIAPHGAAHSFTGGSLSGIDPVWVAKRQYMPLLPRPVVSGTMSLYVEADFWYFGGHYNWWPGSGVAISAAHMPTGAMNARFVTVYMDGVTETLQLLDGPEFNPWFPPDDPGDYISIPSPSVGVPIAAVYLGTGTTFVGWGEIFDLRMPAQPLTNYGLQTGSLTFYDQGQLKGGYGKLDVLGPDLVLNVSGTFASLVQTRPADQIGVMGWDDGVPVGTGTIIDFGDGLAATLSGSTLYVELAQLPGGEELFFHNTGTDVALRYLMDVFPNSSPEVDFSSSISATGTMIVAFITAPSEPGVEHLDEGLYDVHIHARKTAGTKSAVVLWQLFKRSGAGVETLLGTSESSAALTATAVPFDLHLSLAPTVITVTDRLVVKIYGQQSGAGTDPTVALSIEGTTFSHFAAPGGGEGAIGSLRHWDDGAPLGTIGTLDWGDNLNVTVSGTVLRIDAADAPAFPAVQTGTIAVLKDGAFQGEFRKLDFRSNLTITPSGDTAQIDAAAGGPGGGGGAGIMGWDEGIPLGTGTILDVVGGSAELTLSGTVLTLTITAGPGGGAMPRVGVCEQLTGNYWKVPDPPFLTGTLMIFCNGVAQRIITDYTEQFPSSGTFQLTSAAPTGSFIVATWAK